MLLHTVLLPICVPEIFRMPCHPPVRPTLAIRPIRELLLRRLSGADSTFKNRLILVSAPFSFLCGLNASRCPCHSFLLICPLFSPLPFLASGVFVSQRLGFCAILNLRERKPTATSDI